MSSIKDSSIPDENEIIIHLGIKDGTGMDIWTDYEKKNEYCEGQQFQNINKSNSQLSPHTRLVMHVC